MKNENKFKLTTPILYLVFNRLDTVKQTFPEIQKAKPKQLFISADGPRTLKEKKKTDAVRNYIKKNINWNCEVKTLFRKKNFGCKYAVSGAIDWFFKNVEQGIILEDDCLPSQSFFRFCQEMLKRYKNNEKIMHISGTNIEGISKIKEDYFFSKTYNVWGWATWRRAWSKYDVEMKDWPRWRLKSLSFMKGYTFFNKLKSLRLYELTYRSKINTWDYQWDFCCNNNKGFSVIPKKNLITNLGFSKNATHTDQAPNKRRIIKRFEFLGKIKVREFIKENKDYKKQFAKFFKTSIIFKMIRKLKKN